GRFLINFRPLSSVKDDLFTYELGVVEDLYFPFIEQPHDNLKNGDLDVYEPRQCYDEYERMFAKVVILIDDRLVKLIDITLEQWSMDSYTKNALWLYWKRGDDEEVLTKDELSNLKEKDMHVLTGDLPGFKTYEYYKDAWIYEWNKEVPWVEEKPFLDDGIWKEPNDDLCHNCKPFQFKSGHVQWPTCNSNEEGYFNGGNLPGMIRKEEEESSEDAWSNYSPNNDNDAIQADQEWFDNHKDDDIMDLEDYFIRQDASYYVDEEEERFKERKRKLLGMPYKKPPTFKYERFEVIKYSLGPTKEYIAIKEYEYHIWLRTEENVSRVYEEIFHKKDEGWSMTRTK
ncbi:hypothetical protein Tco_1460042, partial [Tanacetum coccineum]